MTLGTIIATVVPITGIIAALIAGFVAWLGHRSSASNAKLSADINRQNALLAATLQSRKQITENRQAWINALRDDLAKYFAATLEIDEEEVDYPLIYETGARIELRMNPNDPDYQPLRDSMHSCIAVNDPLKMTEGREQFLQTSQRILKREWEVLKRELRDLEQTSIDL